MKLSSGAALAVACLLPCVAAAQVKISALPAPSSVAGAAQVPCSQGGVTYACTAAQIAALAPSVDVSGKANKAGDTFTGPVAFAASRPTILGYSPWTTQDFGSVPAGLGANTFSGLQTLNGRQVLNQTGATNDAYGLAIERNSNFTGGTTGYVNRALSCHTQVHGSPNNYEWCGVFVLDNYATGAGQHVGAYFQGNREVAGAAPTWAAVSEVRDLSGEANPTTGLIAHEFDVAANGADANFNRVGLDIFAKTYNTGGAAAQIGYGLRLSTEGSASFINAAAITGSMYAGLLVNPTSSTFGIDFLGAYSGPVVDFSGITTNATNTNLRFAVGQAISLEATGTYRFSLINPTGAYASKAVVGLTNGFSESVGLRLDTGSEGLRINTVPMVGRDPNSVLYLPGAYSSDVALRMPNAAGGTMRFQTFGGGATLGSFSASNFVSNVAALFPATLDATTIVGPYFGVRVRQDSAGGAAILQFTDNAGTAQRASITADTFGSLALNPADGGIYANGALLFANNGQWTANTPSVAPYSGSFTSYTASGRYQRVGGSVNFRFQVAFGGGSGSAPLVGLPSTSSNTIGAVCVGRDSTSGVGLIGNIGANASVVAVTKTDGSGYAPGSDTMVMSCTYEG